MFRQSIFILLLLAVVPLPAKTGKIAAPEATLINLINFTLDSMEKVKGESPHRWGYVDYSKFPACPGALISACSTCAAFEPRPGAPRAVKYILDLGNFKDLQIFLASCSSRESEIKHYHVLRFHFEFRRDSIPRYRYDFIGEDRQATIRTDEHGERISVDCRENPESRIFSARFKLIFNYVRIFRLPRGQR